jgi:ATP-dependent Lhr-like helicase
MTLAGSPSDAPASLSSRAQLVAEFLGAHGASFFDELLGGTRLLHVHLEEALAELVGAGLINSDSYSGLRALLVPSSKRSSTRRRHGRRSALFGIEDAGRWTLVRRGAKSQAPGPSGPEDESVEQVARVLLRRYGVVCWRLLAHEAEWLPPWRELVRVFHRLEARGDIRGGRFIAGISGEQFALPEAIAAMRATRQRAIDGSFVCISGADPLNVVGSLLAGDKVPHISGARVLYRDGVPVARRIAGELLLSGPFTPAEEQAIRSILVRDPPRRGTKPTGDAQGEEE